MKWIPAQPCIGYESILEEGEVLWEMCSSSWALAFSTEVSADAYDVSELVWGQVSPVWGWCRDIYQLELTSSLLWRRDVLCKSTNWVKIITFLHCVTTAFCWGNKAFFTFFRQTRMVWSQTASHQSNTCMLWWEERWGGRIRESSVQRTSASFQRRKQPM